MKLYIARPQGYCIGVKRAIDLALNVRENNKDAKIVILGMLVHNEEVIKRLEKHQIYTKKGLKADIIEFLEQVDKDTHLIITAHGYPLEYKEIIEKRGLIVHDATCPMVEANMKRIKKALETNHQVIYIGKAGHPEVNAALSLGKNVFLYPINGTLDLKKIDDPEPLVINQTTLSILELSAYHEEIIRHIPKANIADEICNATRMRQKAVQNIPQDVELIYIVGSKKSSNTGKLVEVAKETHPNAKVLLIANVDEINENDLKGVDHVAISSGASTPFDLVQDVIDFLKDK